MWHYSPLIRLRISNNMEYLKNTLLYLAGMTIAVISIPPYLLADMLEFIADHLNRWAQRLMDKAVGEELDEG